MKTEIIKNKKVVYFADPMLSTASNSIEHEFDTFVRNELKEKGLDFVFVHCTDIPPFSKMNYDILFFDYGGMSVGNSLTHSFCKQVIKEAENYPNRMYVMVSTMTEYAMQDAMDEFGDRYNIFLSIDKFIKYFKQNYL